MRLFYLTFLLLYLHFSWAQELFVWSEPASNMAAKSLGIRLNNEILPPYINKAKGVNNTQYMYRLSPEFMIGISKKWMLHSMLFFSNIHQPNFKFEGAGLYLKYRFLSYDKVHSHFRVAAYAKASVINNAIQYHEINLNGDNSGFGGGLVATQLIHKLAISFTGGYTYCISNIHYSLLRTQPNDALNYSLSFGLLTLPYVYKNYNQPNLNIYIEFLGKYNPLTAEQYIDFAPALQFIIKSKMRLDIAYRRQLTGNMLRMNNQEVIVKFEYNIFNAY